MIKEYKLNVIEILLLIITACVISLVFANTLWIAVSGIFFLIILYRYGKNFFIIFSFFSFITITTGLSSNLRLLVQIINVTLLFYFFLKIYSFDLKGYPKVPRPIIILVILILSSMALSSLFSNYPGTGVIQIFRTGLFLLIVYLFYSLIETEQDLKLYLAVFVITSIFLFLLVFYLYSSAQYDIIQFQKLLLIDEDINYIHKNTIGVLFAMTISILLAYYFSQSKNVNKKVIILTIVFLIVGLVITNSRAAIFSLIVSSTFVFLVLSKQVLYKFLIAIAIIIPILFIEPISDLIDLYFRLDRIFSGRDVIAEATYKLIAQNPIFGTGPAAAKMEMTKNIPFIMESSDWSFLIRHINSIGMGHAHNFYLFYFSELGILGLITSVTIPLVFFRIGYSTIKISKIHNNKIYYLTVGIVAAGMVMFVRGLFEWSGILSYGKIENDLPLWWLFICLVYINKISTPKTKVL